LAGGGIKPGITYGNTDDFSFNIVENPVHVHDLQATILNCLGIDHERLTYRFQGRHYRLTDVHGQVVRGILA
jgi:arylsulfatase A-like enzyme